MLINVCHQKAAFLNASTADVEEVYAFTHGAPWGCETTKPQNFHL